jgi:hypothetical protein
MVPETVYCEECGQISGVRGYGRVEYDWPKTSSDGPVAAIPVISSIRLTIDCPCCGVKTQDFWPNDVRRSNASRLSPADAAKLLYRSNRINHFAPRKAK